MPSRRAFPLIPRQRTTGVAYGTRRGERRGQGADIAGLRAYQPGDRLAWVDWYASARASLIGNDDVFMVRQYYEEMAPRVVVVVDRRPSMGLFPDDLPWLSKPTVVREAMSAIIAAARDARAYVGYLDVLAGHDGQAGTPHWISPRRQTVRRILNRMDETEFDAPLDSLGLALDFLLELPNDVPVGTFVFVISDFLRPGPQQAWVRAQSRGWDLVPVIVQDRDWEQAFPAVEGILLPVINAETGDRGSIRLTTAQVNAQRDANTARLSQLLSRFRALRFDPVLLDSSVPADIDRAFRTWAIRRRQSRRSG